MNKRWISSFWLCALIWFLACSPARAALSQARFIPCIEVKEMVAASQGQYHYVRSGDNLWNISRSYQVDLQNLMLCNSLNRQSVLRVGQVLQIPNGQGRGHIIRKGETLWDIARRYDVALSQLRQLNPEKKPNNLKIGDQITLPADTATAALATVKTQPSRSITSRFAWPLKGTITSTYGWRSSGFHHGLDIAGNLRDPVKASIAGVVSFTGSMGLYGNTVIIDHNGGFQTLYAHLHTIKVSNDDRVKQGEVIGGVGSTGRSTGPHLHFEIRQGSDHYDPLAYLR